MGRITLYSPLKKGYARMKISSPDMYRNEIMLYKMRRQEMLLRKIDKQSSFMSGVLQNITGDAVFELFLRGARCLFKR